MFHGLFKELSYHNNNPIIIPNNHPNIILNNYLNNYPKNNSKITDNNIALALIAVVVE